jgi:hypothetical protein
MKSDHMVGAVLLLAIFLTPVLGWMLLRRHVAAGQASVPVGRVRLVYIHWSILALFFLFGAMNSWSGLQLLALIYLVLVAAPGALTAGFFWRQALERPGTPRTLWWATVLFAPAVLLVIGAGYLKSR